MVRLARLAPPHVNLYVKVEARNPMGSVKDRLALGIIEDAERRGALKPGQTVVEASSGNTGIALAMVCARKGYPLVVVMAENFSVERRRLMRFLGARVVLTPAAEKGSGMIRKAAELAEKHGWFLTRQFENPANAEMHARTTAPEILADFDDIPLDYFVAGCGTGGTVKGVAQVLRRERPATRIVVCEPDNSPMLGSGVPQPRDAARPAGRQPPRLPAPPDAGLEPGRGGGDHRVGLHRRPGGPGGAGEWRRCHAPVRGNSRSRRASSPASPAARRWPARCRWRPRRRPGRTCSACCPTPASGT